MTDDVGSGLYQFLMTKDSVTELVDDRGFPEALPEKAVLPAFVYDVTNGASTYHMGGSSGLRASDITIKAYADEREEAKQVGEAIRNVMGGFRGQWSGAFIRRCHGVDIGTSYENPVDGSDQGRYLHVLQFSVHHIESVPTFT